jgi:hypothetical protein
MFIVQVEEEEHQWVPKLRCNFSRFCVGCCFDIEPVQLIPAPYSMDLTMKA